MRKFHWLWPTLVYETIIPVDDIQEFNGRILTSVFQGGFSGGSIWDIDTPEIALLKETLLKSSHIWLETANLQDRFEPSITDGWINVYQPGQAIPPHFHGTQELVNLYYLTDEDEDNPLQLMPHYTQMNQMSKRPGHTGFQDPRGCIELRESPPVIEFCPKQGRMITWPGHLQHWTMPTDKLRIIIGGHTKLTLK